MARRLRAFAALAEDPGSGPSTHVVTHISTPVPGDLMPSDGPSKAPETRMTYIHT